MKDLFQKEREWIHRNFDQLVDNYGGKYLAIKGEQILAVGETYSEVLQSVSQQGSEKEAYIYRVPSYEDGKHLLRNLHILGLKFFPF